MTTLTGTGDDPHLLEIRRYGIYVDQPGDVLMVRKVPQKSDLPEGTFCKLNFFKHASDQFDGDGFMRYLVRCRPAPTTVRKRQRPLEKHDSHDHSVCSRAHLSHQLPPFLDMKCLAKGRHKRVVSSMVKTCCGEPNRYPIRKREYLFFML